MVGFEDDDEEISLPDEQRRGDRDDRDVDSKMQELQRLMSYDCDLKQSRYEEMDDDDEDEDDIAMELIRSKFKRGGRQDDTTEFMFEVDDDEDLGGFVDDDGLENDLIDFDLV